MRRSLWLACGMGLGVAMLVAGCSGGDDDDDAGNNPGGSALTPSQLCANVALDTCTKVYTCVTSADQRRALGYDGDSTQCFGDALEQLGCASSTAAKVCAGAQGSTTADAATCSSQVKAANCSDVAAKAVSAYAPACGQCAFRP